jgi:DNA-binding CsgD family transcriptional regulator
MATLLQALTSSHDIRAVDAHGLSLLSKREIEIVRSVAQGLSNREIASGLKLSRHTVKNSLFRIYDKLGVSSRVELLFMTLSQERHAQSALQHFMNERAYESLRDESTLIACREAAARGVVFAQFALAQFCSISKADQDMTTQAYVWYSVLSERIAQALQTVAKELTLEQLLQAEALAAEQLNKKNGTTATATRPKPRPRTLSPERLPESSSATA